MNKKQQLEIQKTLAALNRTINGLEPKQKAAITKHLNALRGQLARLVPAGGAAAWIPEVAAWIEEPTKGKAKKARATPKPKRK